MTGVLNNKEASRSEERRLEGLRYPRPEQIIFLPSAKGKDFMLQRLTMFMCVLVNGLKDDVKSKLSCSLGSRMLLGERQCPLSIAHIAAVRFT